MNPHYRLTVTLELVTTREPDAQGYVRTDSKELSQVRLTGGSEQNVVGQARQHVDVLLNTYAPVRADVR